MDVAIPQQSTDLHVTPGRVRVKSLALKRNPAHARQAELDLASLPEVALARVNATTGSITLHFDPRHWSVEDLIALLRDRGYLTDVPAERRPTSRPGRDMFTECCALIGKELLSTALSRMFPHPLVSTLLAVV